MCKADQDMRERNLSNEEFWDDSVDALNTKRMKEVIDSVGWPTIGMVGRDASHDAWLLVQHADKDVLFQERCLVLMKSAPAGEVDLHDIAYLEDRVRVNKNLPQVYGTQFRNFVLRPIEEPEKVDERRRAMGLSSLAEGIEAHNRKYSSWKPN